MNDFISPTEQELNVREYAQAKRDAALGTLNVLQYEEASNDQRRVLQQIELVFKDLIKKELIKKL